MSDSVLLPRPQGSGLHEQQDRQQLGVLNGGRAAQQLPVVCRVPDADREHSGSYFGLSDRLITDGVIHVHYTRTYASWLNQVERWFGIITQRAIRRGSFSSVKELIAKIEQFVAALQ